MAVIAFACSLVLIAPALAGTTVKYNGTTSAGEPFTLYLNGQHVENLYYTASYTCTDHFHESFRPRRMHG